MTVFLLSFGAMNAQNWTKYKAEDLAFVAYYPKADTDYNSTVLDGAVEGAIKNVQGKLVFDNKIKYNGYPGRNIKIEINGGFIYINAYLVENSMYITQVICLTANDGNTDIERFLNSFEIIKTK